MKSGRRTRRGLGLLLAALGLSGSAAAEGELAWVGIGKPGNAADATGFGAVAYAYAIGVHEVTNAQYAEFLNAVASVSDGYGLYNRMMGDGPHGGIQRSGKPRQHRYSAKPGAERKPVNYVSIFDAMRFANWLHNGRPTGEQDARTTEDGAYAMQGMFEAGPRKPDARFFLPSEDEWYKAAYFDAAAGRYFAFPAGSDERPYCDVPGEKPNTANCANVMGAPTDVGAYRASPSPSGTFDQGGNVWEWDESQQEGMLRGTRGGGFNNPAAGLAAAVRNGIIGTNEKFTIGFRLAAKRVP